MILFPYDFYVNNNKVWFYHAKINALFCYQLGGNTSYVLSCLKNKMTFDDVTYFKVISAGSKLYFIPYCANVLLEYDLDKGVKREIELPRDFNKQYKFVDGFIAGDDLYCVPFWTQNDIIRYSLRDNEFSKEDGWSESVSKYSKFIDLGTRVKSDEFCVVLYGTYKLAFHNTKDHITSIIDFENSLKNEIRSCVCVDNVLYISVVNSKTISGYDINTMNKIKEIDTGYDNYRVFDGGKGKLVISPFDRREIEVISLDSGDGMRVKLRSIENGRTGEFPMGCVKLDERGRAFYFDRIGCELIDLSDNNRYPIFIDSDRYTSLLTGIKNSLSCGYSVLDECKCIGLDDYLEMVYVD